MRKLLYGRVTLLSGVCPRCGYEAFVRNQTFTCCGLRTTETAQRWKRMSVSPGRRCYIPKWMVEQLVLEQGGRCIYCDIRFETAEYRRGRLVRKSVHVDHMTPFSWDANSDIENLSAACSICNGIKSDFLFKTLDDARNYILLQRQAKGYTTCRPDLLLSEVREAIPAKA